VDRNVTYTSLFRAYRADVVRSVDSRPRATCVAELLVNAKLSGYRVAEYRRRRTCGRSALKAKIWARSSLTLRFQSVVLLRRLGIRWTKYAGRRRQAVGQSRVVA
jgi:hypothetical protein